MIVPGTASTAETASEQANDFLMGSFKSRIYAGASRNPPALASSPEVNPTPKAMSASRIRENGALTSGDAAGKGAADFFSPGQIKKESPNPNTKTAVRINKMRAP